jgi:hypothetical protein
MSTKKTREGRPESPPRDLKTIRFRVPKALRDRLTAQALAETKANRLGLVVTQQALAAQILDEGLTRREKATPTD